MNLAYHRSPLPSILAHLVPSPRVPASLLQVLHLIVGFTRKRALYYQCLGWLPKVHLRKRMSSSDVNYNIILF